MTGVTVNKKTEVSIDVALTSEEIRALLLDAAKRKLKRKRKLPEGTAPTLSVIHTDDYGDALPIDTRSLTVFVNYSYIA